jgi:hypothetical protein
VIAKLRERGFHFVTVSTLLGMPSDYFYESPAPADLQTAALPHSDQARTQ